MKRLFSGTSRQEGGTLFQLRNLINRRNVSHVTQGKVNEIEDFFELVTVCHIQAVFMLYFGMKDRKGSPTLNMPTEDKIHHLTAQQRSSLLRGKVADIVDKYITTNWAGARATSDNIRRVTGAENVHEDHNYSSTASSITPASAGLHSHNDDDGVLAYACAVLSDGMFMLEFRDAIREGDGRRVLRCWTVMMIYFKSAQRVKYALEGFYLLAQIKALLPRRLAEEVTWNRFVNNSAGVLGRNISLDFHMEHMNRTYKEQMLRMGSNVTSKTLDALGQAFRHSTVVSDNLRDSTHIHTPSGRHSVADTEKDEHAIIQELMSSQVFTYIPRRCHASFRNIKSNVFSGINADSYLQWLQTCLDQLRKERHIYSLLHDKSGGDI